MCKINHHLPAWKRNAPPTRVRRKNAYEQEESKTPHLLEYVGKTRKERKKKKRSGASWSAQQSNDQSSYASASLGPFRGAVCWHLLSSLSPLSLLPFFFFLSLTSPPPSVLFSKTDSGERHLRSICRLWAHAKHLYCAQKHRKRPSGWWGQNAKPNKIHCSLKTKKHWKTR